MAKEKLKILEQDIIYLEMVNNLHVITTKEKEFITNLTGRFQGFGKKTVITEAQRVWLEDLASRYIHAYGIDR